MLGFHSKINDTPQSYKNILIFTTLMLLFLQKNILKMTYTAHLTYKYS